MHFTPHLLRAMWNLHPEQTSLPLKRTRMVVLVSLLACSSWATICRACLAFVHGEFCVSGAGGVPASAPPCGATTLAAGGGGALLRAVVELALAPSCPGVPVTLGTLLVVRRRKSWWWWEACRPLGWGLGGAKRRRGRTGVSLSVETGASKGLTVGKGVEGREESGDWRGEWKM